MPDAPLLQSRVIARSPVYYGWVVLAAGTFGMMMTLPGQTFAISVFLDPIMAELGLGRSLVSTLYMAATLGGAFLLPSFGRWLDAVGPRRGVTVVVALFGLACLGMGQVQGAISLLVGFFAVRFLGQGSLSLVSQHVINQWFVRRRGFALGLAGVGMAVANASFPLAITAAIAAHGWRATYAGLGLLLLSVMLPVGWGLYRQRPEAYGLLPDGHAPAGADAAPAPEAAWTREQAIRSATFWVFALGGVAVAGLATALIFHHFSIMAAAGVSRETAALVYLPVGVLSAAANLLGGVAVDRFSPRPVLIAAMLFLLAAFGFAGMADGPLSVMAYGAVLGLAMGASGAVSGTAFAHYFGRRHLGSIKGLASTITVAATAVAPLPFALAHDMTGGYAAALWASAALPLGIALAAWRLRADSTLPPPGMPPL